MSRFLKKEKRKQERGITLIALITTIIVLLILAGITIGAITGSNGIIGQAQSAKEETEISQEKEIIDISTVEAMGKNNRGNLEEEEFQNAIDKHTNEKADVTDIGEEFEVFFEETNRYYTVDKNGNILDYAEVVIDNSPGDITKDENGKELAGTADEPYEIWCIEDLCDFSNRINNNKTVSYVILMQTLDFKSNRSYVDGKISTEGLISSCNSVEELKNNLTTGEGFTPIGISSSTGRFRGTFEGNNKEIRNLYINREGYAGLFGEVFGVTINDLGVTGSITSTNNIAGGIAGVSGQSYYNNCYNKAIITSKSYAGGIVGNCGQQAKELNNCYNIGDVTGSNFTGGIAGRASGEVNGCYNLGNIKSTGNYAGGLIGQAGRKY